jgi:signal transduction histidine kinase
MKKLLENRTNQLMQEENAKMLLKAFFDSSPDFQILLNTELEIVVFNKRAAELTLLVSGMPLQTGVNITTYMNASFAAEFKNLSKLALNGQKVEYEHFVNAEDAQRNWFSNSLTPAYNGAEIIGLILIGANVNNQKRQEKIIRHQSDVLSAIAQLQSHQVRQPLTNILGLVKLMQDENCEVQKQYLLCLKHAAEELDNVIHTIVDQSRRK